MLSNQNLYNRLLNMKGLELAYKATQKGKNKKKKESIMFRMLWRKHLSEIQESLANETYVPGDYIHFFVYEPKKREIYAPRLPDKIVQHATHAILKDIYRPVFIKDTYACLDEKGEHRAVEQIQAMMRRCQWENGGGWVLKMDVSKFFYSIDREILKKLLAKKIKDERFLRHLYLIIDSSPSGELGLPLGNVTSQDFANVYMNEIDQFVKRYLGIKYYVRYNDDMVICVPTKKDAQEVLEQIKEKIEIDLHLKLNPKKTKIFQISQGVKALGYKTYTTHRKVQRDSKVRRKRDNKKMAIKVENGEMAVEAFAQSANSWLGHARHSNSYYLASSLFKDYEFITVEKPGYKFGERIRRKRNG